MNKIFPSNIFQALLLLFIGLVTATPVIFITQTYYSHLSADITGSIMFIVLCIAIICVAKVINSKRKVDINYGFALPIKSPKFIALTVLIILIFQAGINAPFTNVLSFYLNGKSTFSNPFSQMPLFLGAILLAPLFEELIFRGTILKGFLTKYTPAISIILSGVLFCAIHIQPVQLFGALFFGILSGWIYYKTESLGLCILLHFLSNFSSQLISYTLFKTNLSGNILLPNIYGPYTFFVIGVSVLVLSYLIFKVAKNLTHSKSAKTTLLFIAD
ncbi:CPBP family intramembrane glutamic endopeptidase [Pedobacter sp.]|uniref:CPBP family intramembrane glutamic endopeptidase n=1 Tax=Pedobacter sp. TaxID=1411316 RepID=UPI003D7F1F5A